MVQNCTTGGPLDVCSICEVLKCDLNPRLNSGWLNENPRFTAIRCRSLSHPHVRHIARFFNPVSGNSTLMVTMPV